MYLKVAVVMVEAGRELYLPGSLAALAGGLTAARMKE